MTLYLPDGLLTKIRMHGEKLYPEEGAGLLLGTVEGDKRQVRDCMPLPNSFENSRRNRYLIAPQQMLTGEQTAESMGLDVVGVFHSHPDHPADPSSFDLQWALPWYSYLITTIEGGRARVTRSWRLSNNRTHFTEESVVIQQSTYAEETR